jgi:hypothetical protein
MSSNPAPMAILMARTAADGGVLDFGGLLPVARTVSAITTARDRSQPKTNAAPFLCVAIRGEDQEERRERERFERDGQTGENEVNNHDRLGLPGEAVRILSWSLAR